MNWESEGGDDSLAGEDGEDSLAGVEGVENIFLYMTIKKLNPIFPDIFVIDRHSITIFISPTKITNDVISNEIYDSLALE